MKTDRLRSLKGFRPYLFIAAATVAAHGLILLNQGVYWDDWLNYTFVAENRWQNLYSDFFLPAGRPIYAVMFWFLGFFPDPIVAHRWLTLGLLMGTGCLIYAIGISTKWLTSFESVALAILTIVYPAFKVAFGFTLLPYVLSYFLFVLGAWLSYTMVNHTAGSRRVLLRILSLLIFALSFTVESFLIFYYWFLGLLFITVIDKGQPVSYYIKRLIHFADYALLPFVYWTVDWYAFPVGDIFAQQHWNTIRVNLTTIGDVFYRFIRYAIWQSLSDFHVLVWLFVLAALSLLRLSWDLKLGKGRRDYLIVLVGIVGLLFGILPYALIGKAPGPGGWETRHALLIGLPAALTLIGLLRLGFSGQQQSGIVVFSIVAVLVAGFSYDLWRNYIEWQSRWVKDLAIIANLRELDEEEVAKVSVYLIDDHTRLAGKERYRFYEWAGLFREAWGTETHIGLTSNRPVEEFLNDNPNADSFFSGSYLLSDVNPSGCQATLTIVYAERIGDLELVLRYFYFKFLKPADLNEFLLHTILMNQHSFEC